jgi:hypothetical protein
MEPTVDAWKLIPLDLYNQINNVVNEQRLISEHALDLDVSIPDGMISLISGTHQLSSVLVLSRHASETWSLDFEIRTTPSWKSITKKSGA